MKGIFVNENGGIRYADAIVNGYKTIETRSRNMLSELVDNSQIAIIRTRKGKNPMVVGYAHIFNSWFCEADKFDNYRQFTLIPDGSSYDVHGKGKWMYEIGLAYPCIPYPRPSSAFRHGRSWCEWEEV